jgi:hypothetical protein
MSQTITSGIQAIDGFTVRPVGTITWADLGSAPYTTWDSWTNWTQTPGNIVVSETVDTGSVDHYLPLADVLTEGDLTVTVDVSDTGLFAGEETTTSFTTDDVGQSLVKGRHIRWNFTVAPTVAEPVPYLQYFVQANNNLKDIYLDDVAVPELATDSLGFRLIDHPLGAVKNVQATTLQGDDYVDNGYVLVYDQLDSYVRTANDSLLTTHGTPTYVDGFKPRLDKAIQFNGTDTAVEFDNSTNGLISGYPFTIDFLFKVPPISASDPRAQGKYLFASEHTGLVGNQIILVYIQEGDSTDDSELVVGIPSITGNQIVHQPFPLQGDRWYHYSLTVESAQSIRSFIATADGENSGDGVGEGNGDVIESTSFDEDLTIADTYFIGKWDVYGTAQDFANWEDVEIDEFRITDGAEQNADNYWVSPGYIVTPFTSDANTSMLLHFDDSVADDNLVRTGTEDYFYRQNGGSAVVEQKNPLALKIVDYNGDAWDGAIDLHLRGLPKIAKLGNSLVEKFD